MDASDAQDPPAHFEALIVPHRSLGPAGLRWLAIVLCTLSGCISLGLWLVGAWPVIGFTGLEAGLAILLLRWNARRDRGSEMLLLTDAGLRIVRTAREGYRYELMLDGGWLRATLQERRGRVSALLVHDRGMHVEIGAELGEAEKQQLAASLQTALERRRHPIFDNPQLR